MRRYNKVLGVGLIFAAVVFGVTGVPRCEAVATEVDLTTTPVNPININGALWDTQRIHTSGTGVFQPFLRIQGDETKQGYDGVEKGYNTGGALEFETKAGIWTHPLALSSLQNVEGFYQFFLDADQNASTGNFLSIDDLIISQETSPNLTGYPSTPHENFGGYVVYDLDAVEDLYVKIDYTLSGEGLGSGDVVLEIPVSMFSGEGQWVYFYSRMGVEFGATDGPENWNALLGETTPVPAPGAVLLGGIGISLVGWLRRKKAL